MANIKSYSKHTCQDWQSIVSWFKKLHENGNWETIAKELLKLVNKKQNKTDK